MAATSNQVPFDWLASDRGDQTAVIRLSEHPGWVAMLSFMLVGGDVRLVDLTIGFAGDLDGTALLDWAQERNEHHGPASPPPGQITTRLLRGVGWGDLQRTARDKMASGTLPFAGPAWTKAARQKPGPKPHSDAELARLAAAYCSALSGPKPVETVGKAWHVSPSVVRNRLHEARRRDLLTGAGQGRAGGSLTDKAKEILNGLDQ